MSTPRICHIQVSKYTSVATGTRPLDSRSIRKPYSFDELLKAAKDALSTPAAVQSLPSLPRSLATLPCLHGDKTLLVRLVGDSSSSTSGVGGGSGSAPLTAVTFRSFFHPLLFMYLLQSFHPLSHRYILSHRSCHIQPSHTPVTIIPFTTVVR